HRSGSTIFVEGYEGSVTIDNLARTYLESEDFQSVQTLSLRDRLTGYNLWGRLKQLHTDNPPREFYQSPRYIFFRFSQDDFTARWPDAQPFAKDRFGKWIANEKMVESAL